MACPDCENDWITTFQDGEDSEGNATLVHDCLVCGARWHSVFVPPYEDFEVAEDDE